MTAQKCWNGALHSLYVLMISAKSEINTEGTFEIVTRSKNLCSISWRASFFSEYEWISLAKSLTQINSCSTRHESVQYIMVFFFFFSFFRFRQLDIRDVRGADINTGLMWKWVEYTCMVGVRVPSSLEDGKIMLLVANEWAKSEALC